jgi:hypothetical protein
LAGNHDEKISRKHGDYVGEMIASVLGVPYLGYGGFINLGIWWGDNQKTPNFNYVIYMHHGHGVGITMGGHMNNLTKMSHKYDANLYLFGHKHHYAHHEDYRLGVKGDGLFKKNRTYLLVPSYVDAYDSEKSDYVKRGAMQPSRTGCVRIELHRFWNDMVAKIRPMLE